MARFEKGHKKSGGRKKGTPNKFNSNLKALCEQSGLNPFMALLSMAKDPKTKQGIKFGALKELCEYMFAKRRRIEFDEDNVLGIVREIEILKQLPTDQLVKLAKDEMEKLDDGRSSTDDL